MPASLNRDVSTFFMCFTKACRQADDLLFRSGNAEAVDEACKRAPIGKLLPNALYVHRDTLDSLEPLLRVYEGCARAYLGEVEGANLIKLHRHSGKVSYLVYPDFETDPHPALLRTIKLSLRTRELNCYGYATSTNPPHPSPQGIVPSARARARGQVLPADPAGGKARAARRDGDDRHARGLAATAGGAGSHDSGASAGPVEGGPRNGGKGRGSGTTKLTNHAKKEEK